MTWSTQKSILIAQSGFHDDGNWSWEYKCQYITPTNNPKDWFYAIAFYTDKGGYLNDEEISCNYWQAENLLQIVKKGVKINFYVENFSDIKIILNPMIKANKAIIYPLHESKALAIKKLRKDKLNKINKLK